MTQRFGGLRIINYICIKNNLKTELKLVYGN